MKSVIATYHALRGTTRTLQSSVMSTAPRTVATIQSTRVMPTIFVESALGVMPQIFMNTRAYAGVNESAANVAATTVTANANPSAPSRSSSSPSSTRSSICDAKTITAKMPKRMNFSG